MNRQRELIEINIQWLNQAMELLESIDDRSFCTAPNGMPSQRASSHLRHIIEFYECFLDGLSSTHIDYDARKRDESMERNCAAAADKVRSVIRRIESARELTSDAVIFVRMEDADTSRFNDPFLLSSVARELQALSSHTIHHFALIAMTLRLHGCDVPPDLGMAPSTLRFRTLNRAKAAEAA